MKLPNETCHQFPGQVKFSGGSRGTVHWKSGSLLFNRTETGWTVNMLYDCATSGRPVLTLQLSPSVLKKHVCKNTFFMDTKTGSGLLTWYLRPLSPQMITQIQAIMDDVLKSSPRTAEVKAEVAVKKGVSPIRPSQTNTDKENMDESAHKFTSVKESKRADRESDSWHDQEGKENRIKSTDRNTDQFLQRSAEKSRECLKTLSFYSKTSSSSSQLHIPSIKRPGLMPDPTPIKRSRLSDAIPYSMKKLATPTDQKLSQALQGFSNLGNTCYMNAILQSLFGLDSFSLDLTTNRRLIKLLPPPSLYIAMVKLLYARRQSSDMARKEYLRRVKSAISTSAKRFSGYGQHDAHEFLGQVLDQLKEEVLKVYKGTPSPSPSNPSPLGDHSLLPDSPAHQVLFNPITVNFEFEVLHTLTCLECGEQVSKAEQFHDISLDVPKRKDFMTPRSLQDAISMFFRSEQIEYTCEKCGYGKSNVSHKITRLPRVFILHLKRYNYNQTVSRHTKMTQNVSIPLYLTLDHHCTEATQPAHPPILHHAPHSEDKSLSGSDIADDSEASSRRIPLSDSSDMTDDSEPNSRRKLDYQKQHSGYKFHKKEPEEDGVVPDVVAFTETKDKKVGREPSARRTLTLEDEDVDADMARAIEISLKEQEESDQMRREYGEDTADNFERVLQMSRTRHDDEQLSRRKNINDLSEEEMIQIAIEQSLQDNDKSNHGNNTQTDDIIKHADNQDHNYIQHDIDVDKMDFLIADITNSSNNNNVNNVVDDDVAIKAEADVTNNSSGGEIVDVDMDNSNWHGIGYSTPRHLAPVSDPQSETDFSPIMLFKGEICRGDRTVQSNVNDSSRVKEWTRKHWRDRASNVSSDIEGACGVSSDIEGACGVSSDIKGARGLGLDGSTVQMETDLDVDKCKNNGNKSYSSNNSTLSVLSPLCRETFQSSSLSDLDENMNDMKCDNSESESVGGQSAAGAAGGGTTTGRGGGDESTTTAGNGGGTTTGRGGGDESTTTAGNGGGDDDACRRTTAGGDDDGTKASGGTKAGNGGDADRRTTTADGGDGGTTTTGGRGDGGSDDGGRGDGGRGDGSRGDGGRGDGGRGDGGRGDGGRGDGGRGDGGGSSSTTTVNVDCIETSNVEIVDMSVMDPWSDLPDLEDISTEDEVVSSSVGEEAISGDQPRLSAKHEANKPAAATDTVDDLLCDEDDSWLNSIDDKENKFPLTTERPRLSDPEEFVVDDNAGNMADEVDGEGEQTLELPVIDNEKGDLPYTYRLVSIVNHMGVSSNTGHYLSDVYDLKKKAWYSFDDSHVAQTTETDVRTRRERSGYIFFYTSGDIFDDLVLHHATAPSPQSAEQKLKVKKRMF